MVPECSRASWEDNPRDMKYSGSPVPGLFLTQTGTKGPVRPQVGLVAILAQDTRSESDDERGGFGHDSTRIIKPVGRPHTYILPAAAARTLTL